MRAYKKRPETFRFRVLEYCYGNVTDLQHLEQKWLDKIHDNELMLTENIYNNTCRYYNVKKWAAGGNGKGTNKGKKNGGGWNKGKKMSKSVNPGGGWNKGKQGEFYHSAESRKKMSESAKRRWRDNPPIRMKKQYKEKNVLPVVINFKQNINIVHFPVHEKEHLHLNTDRNYLMLKKEEFGYIMLI